MDKEFPGSRENLDLAVQYHASVTEIINYIASIKFYGRNVKYIVFREYNWIFHDFTRNFTRNDDSHATLGITCPFK